METRQIVIKPVTKNKFSGVSSYTGTHYSIEGAQLGNNGYKTGLSSTEASQFENELNLPKNTLAPHSSYWATVLNLNLPNDKQFIFRINGPLDEIKYRVLTQRTDIAKNKLELAKNPNALFYIEDLESEAKMKEKEIDIKMEAMEYFTNLTAEERKGYLRLYGKKGLNSMTDLVIKTTLYKEVEANPKKFIDYCKNEDIEARIEAEEFLEKGLLTKKGQYYHFEGEVLGNSMDDVVGFLKDLKNQSIKIALKAAAQKKDKK